MNIQLGEIIVHDNAAIGVQQANQKVEEFLDRFRIGDYGDIDQEIRQFNEDALKNGGDVLGCYEMCSGLPLWIVSNGKTTQVFIP